MKNELNQSNFIIPNWPAPVNVHALQTNRGKASGDAKKTGLSLAPYNNVNLGSHVGDNPQHVAQNRQFLSQFLPSEPVWLNQVHGIHVMNAGVFNAGIVNTALTTCPPDADASFSTQKNVVCVVMTADCLPVLLCDEAGTVVVAVHAGWRGLCDGALEASIDEACRVAQIKPADLMAWLGPAIGPNAFEVGAEVRAQFIQKDNNAAQAFKKHGDNQKLDKWLANIYLLARQRLNNVGVTQIYGGDLCTYSDAEQFFSFRRDGATGRMATLIWLE